MLYRSGDDMSLEILGLKSNRCCEFIVTEKIFSYRKWIIITLFINAIAIYFELHAQDHRILLLLLVGLATAFIAKINLKVNKESLLVVSSLGIQITTTFVSGRRKSQFYSQSEVLDIVINEGIRMHQVIFYLCVLLKSSSSSQHFTVVPLFQHCWPRLAMLQKIYNGAWPLLHQQKCKTI